MDYITQKMIKKLKIYDSVLDKICEMILVDKEDLKKKLLEPGWFREFYYYAFNLDLVLKKDPDTLKRLKFEINRRK